MPRFYVFPDQASAQACVAGVDARARELYARQGFTVLSDGGVVSKDAAGRDMPGAITLTRDVPRQRLDGRWVVAHCETVPDAGYVLDAAQTPPLTVAAYVAQDIAPSVDVETEDASWWPAPIDEFAGRR